MNRSLIGLAIAFGLLLSYLLAWPVPIEPVAWRAPENPGLTGPFAPNDALSNAKAFDLGVFEGPEDVALGGDGALYATTSDGSVIRIDPASDTITEFARVNGRPLGIEVNSDSELFIANAYVGIQKISRDGSISELLTSIDGVPLVFADDLAIGADGIVYISEASTKFGVEAWGGSYAASLLDIMEHGAHGRVIAFDPGSGDVRVIVDGLDFANGVALNEDQRFLLVAETGSYRILKHWLQGPDAGTTDVLIDNLPGFPDNINAGSDGRFWVGLIAPRDATLDWLSDKPFLRKVVQRLPAWARPRARPSSHVIAISGDGEVLINLQDPDATYPSMTGVCETSNRLYLTRLFGQQLPYVDKSVLIRQ